MNRKDFSIKIAAADARKTRERDYWLKKLSADGGPVKSCFPYDFPYKKEDSEVSGVRFKNVKFKLSEREFALVTKLAGDSHVKLYILLAAILNLLLDRYLQTCNHPDDSERDIIIGAPISRQEEEANLINTILPIRSRFNAGMSVKELLMQMRETIIEAVDHQNYPIASLPGPLGLADSGPGFPLFDIGLLLTNIHERRYIEDIPLNVIFSFCRTPDAVEGIIEYNSLLYKEDTMKRLGERFTRLLENALEGLDKPLYYPDMVSEAEKAQVLVEFNRTETPYPADKTLHRLFEEQAGRTPGHTALISTEQLQVTYLELNEKSNRLGHYLLHGKGVGPDGRVGVLMESSPHLAAAILGILKAGGAYLPIEPSLPEERMKTIIRDASVGVVLSQKKYLRLLNRLQWECDSFHTYLCMDTRDIYGEEEEEKSRLMDKNLWEYVGKSAADDIAGGGWLSSYTGEPFSREEMDEYGDNVLKKLTSFLHPQMRVLEIGCASGITMYRIAPAVGFYYGTDLSQTIVEKNKKRIRQEGHQNIKLSCAVAHEIRQLQESNFDLVIMNSVIQCFHGHHYLWKVIRTCIDLIGEQGYLFIGDIMDQQLKDALICEMNQFKRADRNRNVKTDYSEELFISRAFFADLAVDMPVIKEVSFSRKIRTIENELTKFRYDVLITIDKRQRTSGKKRCRHKYQQDIRAIEAYGTGQVDSRAAPGNLAYVIYTSGSTGRPKGVMVEHRGVVNTLFYRKEAYRLDASGAALQLFSYAFDGFVTAFFTPLLSGAAVVLPGAEAGKDILKIKEAIVAYNVVHFISVPALFRVIMEALTPEQASSLKVVALAGDKLTPGLLDLAGEKNRDLEIVNEYGVTEAAVMSTLYRHQEKDDIIKIGRPIGNTRIYILDKGGRPQPVGIYGELCIAGVGVARGYLNQPELTAEKFCLRRPGGLFSRKLPPWTPRKSFSFDQCSMTNDRLYLTGDLARWLTDGAIEFAGRIDAQVKIRGFRIETGEIESLLRTHEDVNEALVTLLESGVGESSLCAYVVPGGHSPEAADLKEYLARQLPDYMIPVYFVFIEKIPLTVTGKVDRKALPEPETIRGGKSRMPRDEVEKKLAEIWTRVLGLDVSQGIVGIDDSFFELGGHSLRATALIAAIHKEMNVEVPLGEVFKTPYIRDLAQYIREASRTQYFSMEAAEKREYYPLSAAQLRFYMMEQMVSATMAYNMPQVIPLGHDVDKEKVENTFKQLIRRHESLRTAFMLVNDEPVQRIYDEVEFEIQYHSLERREDKEGLYAGIIKDFIRPFDLSRSPLLRVGLIKDTEANHLLLVDMHHLISDGTSQIVLAGDFISFYKGEKLGPIRLQYRDFSQWQKQMLNRETGRMKEDEAFWLDHLSGRLPVLNMPTDFPRPRVHNYAGETFTWRLGRELSPEVNRLIRQTGATLYMVMLTALNILLFRYTGQQDIIIGSLISGRNHADLEGIIGLVMGPLPIRNFPCKEKTIGDFLEKVKERTLAAYEHQAYPYEELLKKLDYEDIPGRNPITDISLIGQNMFPDMFAGGVTGQQGDITAGAALPQVSKMDLTLNVLEQGGEIVFSVEYRTALFRRGTIERLLGHLASILKNAAANPGIRIGEIDVLTGDEKQKLIGTDAPFYPLTHPQKRIYYTEKRYPRTTALNVAFAARYPRVLDRKIWREAVNRLLQNNEALRIRIVECDPFNEPFQYIAPYTPYAPDEIDFSGEEELAEWLDRETRKPIDLYDRDLFYFAYLGIDDNTSGYYLRVHHVVSDAGGGLFLFNKIDEIYRALAAGNPPDHETDPSYLRYISEENRYLASPQAREDKAFWHEYLLPLPEPVDLSTLAPARTNITEKNTAKEDKACDRLFPIANDLRNRLHQYCRENKTSLFKVILSALSVYISRVTGSDDFVVGSFNHNRPTREHWRITGMFASTVPLRIRVDGRMSFGDFVERTGKEVNYILKNHQQYPFDRLVEELRVETGVDPGYLLNVNLIGMPGVSGAEFEVERPYFGAEPVPLTILIDIRSRDASGILELEWDYQVHHFTAEDIERMHRGLVNILGDALADSSKPLWQIEWLSEEEKQQVIVEFNRSGTVRAETFCPDKSLHRLFVDQAEKSGDSAALVGNGSITYAELNRKSGQLAVVLKEKGVLADDIIAIMVERSVEMIIGILGILKTGAAYLPIDPDYPQERIDYMLKDSNASILFATESTENTEAVGDRNPKGHRNLLSDIGMISWNKKKKIEYSGTEGLRVPPASVAENSSSNLAYIIYTSGSTGRPKGVAVTHGNVVNYLNAFDWQFDLQPTDVVVQQASYAFDAFVEEMYPVLLKGGVLAIPAREEVVDVQRLVDFMTRHQVTMITCSPLMLSQLNQHPAIGGTAVRIFISGGDRLKSKHMDNLLEIETASVYNTYGPTETTVCAAYYRVTGSDGAAVPIGQPIPGYQVYILDANLQPVPKGVNGELCIAGPGAARGYLNNPELTNSKFQITNKTEKDETSPQNTFNEKLLRGVQGGSFLEKSPPGRRRQKLYKTGDLARWLPDGNVEFVGRMDNQVNIRGYRVEPGEIENRLIKLDTIDDALVVAKEDSGGDLYLCAYITAGDRQVDGPALREYLLTQLPAYMVPAFFVAMESIPLTPNGKPDLQALPDPLSEPVDDYQPPADRIEEELVTLWSGVLGISPEHISVTASFFDIGGQSIKATKLVSRIHKHFNVKIPLAEVFNQPFVRRMAEYIKDAARETFTAIGKAEEKEYYALSSAQKRLYIVQQMEPSSIAYNVPVVVELGQNIEHRRLQQVFRKLVERHESFRTSFVQVEGEPVQRVHEADEVTFEIEYYESAQEGIVGNFVRPFDIAAVPLLRVGLIKREEEKYVLLLDSHHIISDGASREILVREFVLLSNGMQLPPLKLQYRDFSEWQNNLFVSGEIKKQEEYWLNRFKGDIPVLNLPTDFPREAAAGESGSRLRFPLEKALAKQIQAISKETETTLFMVFLAVYTFLLTRYSFQDDIIIGTGTTGRNHADLENIIGMFVNTLPLRNRVPHNGSFREFLYTVKKNVLEVYENEDFQYEELVNRLGLERTPGRNPLFDCTYTFQKEDTPENAPGTSPAAPQMPPNTYEHPVTKFDLLFKVTQKGDRLDLMLEYKTALFKESTIEEFKDHLVEILEQVAVDIDIPLEDIDLSHRLLAAQSTILQEEDDEFGF